MKRQKRYTLAKIMSWRPCYSRKQVRRLMGRKRSVTLIDILCCDDLPDADAVWVATRTMDDRNNRLFACDCAESVLHLAADPRCTKAIRVACRFADGLATADELRAAKVAAKVAAESAARAAAEAAADAAHSRRVAAGLPARNQDAAVWGAGFAAYAAKSAVWTAADAAAYAADDADAAVWGTGFAEAARSAALAAADAAAYAAKSAAGASRSDACADQRQALLMLALAGEIE